MELGIYTFVENTPLATTGARVPHKERIANLLEEVRLADQVGLDVFAIGEHHRPEYLSSSPSTLLAAAAAATTSIRLSSAVTVLGSEDPVRVFQQFATIDLISAGRAEVMAGRGSFIESFPLFGQDLNDYDSHFSENLDLLLKLRESEVISWSGKHRAPIDRRGVYPRPVQDPLPVWLAVGGTPASVVRAGTLGLPLALAIIGGRPARFAPLVQLYRKSLAEAGHDPNAFSVGINSHGFLAETESEAMAAAYAPFKATMDHIGRERGWPPLTRAQFDSERGPEGALLLGSPEQLIDKILWEHDLFGHQRTMIQLSVGSIPHKQMLKAIELLGTRVAPAVRKAVQTTA